MAHTRLYMGIDIGSVSLNIVVVDEAADIKTSIYRRTEGQPMAMLLDSLEKLGGPMDSFEGVVATGSGRKLVGRVLNVPDVNEIVTQATAACHFHPRVRTIIEIGGQDSKLVFVDRDAKTGAPVIIDHVLNEVCAAGTGSFLDLQAQRLGMTIEDLGALALCSKHPARISGRCSVFAKSDMVHLLQEGTPKADIVAGLCSALALNFITNLGKGKPFPKPILFQGGVAANPGVVNAFEKCLGLDPGDLTIPEHFLVMGAFGSALMAKGLTGGLNQSRTGLIKRIKEALDRAQDRPRKAQMKPLVRRRDKRETSDHYYGIGQGDSVEVFLGVDIGAVSTNIVLIDRKGQLKAKQYWYTRGEPVDTVRSGLEEMADQVGQAVRVCGVGVTGSGRYFIGDFVGADVVINEISAQARAAMHLDPDVDTIIEIGGQDSKYIRCKNGRVIDFEMNKVCAAGTGSFLEEQAARLKVPIRRTFSELAFSSSTPADLGARCTVFMESDLIHHQQTGETLSDLTAGLSYAIAQNYLEKVVGTKRIGDHIVFQGGVAANQSVAAAFENILEKALVTVEHHNVTGALGAALAARDREQASSRFAGFHLKDRPYEVKTFECQKCPNLCRIHQIYIDGRLRSYYGSLCGRYERSSDHTGYAHLPDLFEERQNRLLEGFDKEDLKGGSAQIIGIPNVLSFFDYLPFWMAFLKTLGHPVLLSEGTNKTLIQRGLSCVPSETCFPIKAVYGHIRDLVSKGADLVLLPCETDHPTGNDTSGSFNCPYMQSMPYMVKAAMGSEVALLAPVIRWRERRQVVDRALLGIGRSLGHRAERTKEAIAAGRRAQARFENWRQDRGKEILASLGPQDRCLVLLGKSHNIFDPGLNLHLARKLRRHGQRTIPFDMLPLDDVTLPQGYDNVVWKNTRDLLKACLLTRYDQRLFPVLLTNFGCGPDSFFMKYMEAELTDKPYLVLEVDDHTGDAGMVTRIEAFLDTLDGLPSKGGQRPQPLNLVIRARERTVDRFGPDPQVLKLLENRTLYFPYVSRAFSTIVEAAFRSMGLEAEVLPEPDDETEYMGRQVTSGRECHPFIVTCGDFVKLTRRPEFDPERTAIWMANYDGACRFSQYGIGHADLFRRLGFSEVPVIAPLTSTRYDEFSGLFGLRFTQRLWQGWLAAEVLERIRLHVRPYEKKAGDTDRVFGVGIQGIASAVAQPNGRHSQWSRRVLEDLTRSVNALSAVPVDRSEKRPTIGILGEFYTVLNRWANHDLIRTLEGLGVEVITHGLTVTNFFTLFSNHYYHRNCLKRGKVGAALYYFLRNQWIMSWVRRIEAYLPEALRPFKTLDSRTVLREVEPFIHYDIDPVLATFTARVRGFAASGVSGLCNLFVLNCMLGNVSVPIFKNALKAHQNLPVLHAVYDGQKQTNMLTRIEAFVHQAKLHQEHHAHGG
ncbi:MAG: acyl-CoA dehydratase activase [Thermodesulfobacteriota bacterium]|nr:acyl-CoA dehydratase activase [Thermodesulfobacteriota bacterium]